MCVSPERERGSVGTDGTEDECIRAVDRVSGRHVEVDVEDEARND